MRKFIFANGEIYHVFNRGIERRPTFRNVRDYQRALTTLNFYRYERPELRLAKVLSLRRDLKKEFFLKLYARPQLVDLLSFCFMPNHFHLLLRQNVDQGISRCVSNFTNSYTKYVNKKNRRVGPLFQGIFKAVRIETDEQLIHVSRYIHLNTVASFIIKADKLDSYPWSSFPEYVSRQKGICHRETILTHFASPQAYWQFVHDQIDYAQKLEKIKHLLLE